MLGFTFNHPFKFLYVFLSVCIPVASGARDVGVVRRMIGLPVGNDRLFVAAATGDVAGIRQALAEGASVDARGGADCTPLTLAASGEHLGAIDALLAAGAQVDAPVGPSRLTPLLAAVELGRVRAVERLLRAGANPLAATRCGHTPISIAEEKGEAEILRLLRRGQRHSSARARIGSSP